MIKLFRKIKTAYKIFKRKVTPIPFSEKVKFDSRTINEGHFLVTYRGVSMVRCPFDYVMYQMIINEIQPDLVIEIGTNHGGTSLYIADIMDTIGHGMVHTIDIVERADKKVANNPRIKLFTSGWQNYNLNEAASYKKVMVIEDGSHMYEDCIGALNKFANIVSLGSYYIVEDGIVSSHNRDEGFHGGPLRAIREFFESNSDYTVDRKYCDMFGKNATFNVNGYLKRIK
jgi:cephalosporin hydroxylase